MFKLKFDTKTIAGLGILSALVIALQILSNYVTFGPVSITLALTPVVVGACLYGPLGGLFLGVLQGILILTAPSTAFFFNYSPFGTIITCLLKNGLAGFVSGVIFKAMEAKTPKIGSIIAAVSAPIVNTGVFSIFACTLFYPIVEPLASGENFVVFYLTGFIGINFIIELVANSVLSPVVYQTYKAVERRK